MQQQPKEVFVDLGYRGATVPAGVKVYHRKLRRGITTRLKRDIRRRSAIEPVIGHMKNDGRLRRNWLQGTEGDAFHAILCRLRTQPADDPEEAATSSCLDFPALGLAINQ